VLLELAVVEQRYQAVREVLDGAPVTVVARRFGVARQTVHEWLRRYAADGGLANLADRSSRPRSCPHQMPAAVEARIVAGFGYPVGSSFAGEHVEVVVTGGLVEILHAGVLVASHVQRLRDDQRDRLGRSSRSRAQTQQRTREATAGLTVTPQSRRRRGGLLRRYPLPGRTGVGAGQHRRHHRGRLGAALGR